MEIIIASYSFTLAINAQIIFTNLFIELIKIHPAVVPAGKEIYP